MVADEVRPARLDRQIRPRLERRAERRRVPPGEREVEGLHPHEVELQVELATLRTAEVLQLLVVGQVDLAQQHRLAAAPPEEALQVAEERVRVAHVLTLGRFDEEGHGIHAETRDAQLHPEADDLRDLVADLRVGDVQIGLVPVERVQEVLLGLLVVLPDRIFLAREDHVRCIGGSLIGPDVEVAVGRGAAAAGGDEPRMPVGGVVDDEVDDHADAAIPRHPDDLHEIAVGPQPRVDAVEVADVVPVVAVGGRVNRHQPQARDAEVGEIVDALGQTLEVTDAVPVRIEIGLDIQAVVDRRLPPQVGGVRGLHTIARRAGRSSRPARSMNERWSGPTSWR